jgi:hypothetical protein
VGEFGLPEEEVAVFAALSSHASAQYFPDVVPPSPLVAAVVEHACDHLGEVAAALPPGSVLLVPPQAQYDGEEPLFESTPAIAVATTAAYFETAGQSISSAKDEILLVASAAHRATHDGISAEGELAAAVHGGLIKVVSQPGAAPRIERLAPPAGLHLVVFKTGDSLLPVGWLAGVRQFAERDPIAHARIIDDLLEHAGRFATALSEGNATAAIASSGRYGQGILQLAAAASVPLQSVAFVQAMELAKEIGGIAKTASADRGDLGVALFATPEAASLFARACQPPLVPLRVELDSSGVRCLVLPQAGESAAVYTPAPETGASSISAEAVVRSLVEDKTTEKTLGQQDSAVLPTSHRVVPETQASALASEPIIIEEAPTPASGSAVIVEAFALASEPVPLVEALAPATEPAAEESAMQNGPAVRPPRRRRWIAPAVGGVLIVGTLFAVWLTKTLDNHKAPPDTNQPRVAPTLPESPPSTENEVVPTSGGMVAPPVAPPDDPASPPSAAQRSRGSTTSTSSGKPLPAAQATPSGRPRARAGRGDPANPPLLRAGKLSTDDF